MGTTPEVAYTPVEVVKVDPTWPKPLATCKFDALSFEVVDNKVYLNIPYGDSLDFRSCQEDKLRYIKDLTTMVCSYREHLNEKRCEQFISNKISATNK